MVPEVSERDLTSAGVKKPQKDPHNGVKIIMKFYNFNIPRALVNLIYQVVG